MTTFSFLENDSDLCVTLDGVQTHYLEISKVEEMNARLRELENQQSEWFKAFQNIASVIGFSLTGHGAVDLLPHKVREAINAGRDNYEIRLDAPPAPDNWAKDPIGEAVKNSTAGDPWKVWKDHYGLKGKTIADLHKAAMDQYGGQKTTCSHPFVPPTEKDVPPDSSVQP